MISKSLFRIIATNFLNQNPTISNKEKVQVGVKYQVLNSEVEYERREVYINAERVKTEIQRVKRIMGEGGILHQVGR